MKLIDKSAVVAEIERRLEEYRTYPDYQIDSNYMELCDIISFLDSLDIIDPYEKDVQYPSVKDAIQAHAETYSFNIESKLFNQLTKEQQVLWRKEIEQACISGGEFGVELARDIRYKENVEVKEIQEESYVVGKTGKFTTTTK